MSQLFLALAAAFGFVSVALGAFAAHGLKHQLSDKMLSAFTTGVEYQMYHALALILVAVMMRGTASAWLNATGWLFTAGIVVFSGSLYALALSGVRWFGPITPIGGICFLLGWISLFIAALKHVK